MELRVVCVGRGPHMVSHQFTVLAQIVLVGYTNLHWGHSDKSLSQEINKVVMITGLPFYFKDCGFDLFFSFWLGKSLWDPTYKRYPF